MTTLALPDLNDELLSRLRVCAAEHGRSMEEEARAILRGVLEVESLSGRLLVEAIRSMVAPFGGVVLELPERGPGREPSDFR